jgi:hypothetical protein
MAADEPTYSSLGSLTQLPVGKQVECQQVAGPKRKNISYVPDRRHFHCRPGSESFLPPDPTRESIQYLHYPQAAPQTPELREVGESFRLAHSGRALISGFVTSRTTPSEALEQPVQHSTLPPAEYHLSKLGLAMGSSSSV